MKVHFVHVRMDCKQARVHRVKMCAKLVHVWLCTYVCADVRECGSTLYVGMAQGVRLPYTCIGIGVKFQNTHKKTAKERYIELNIEWAYCKLTLKVSAAGK